MRIELNEAERRQLREIVNTPAVRRLEEFLRRRRFALAEANEVTEAELDFRWKQGRGQELQDWLELFETVRSE